MRTIFALILGCHALASALPGTTNSLVAADASGPDSPNILFIYLDDFGWRDAGFMGSDFYETPHLDQLASNGMVFTQAYAGAANCAPSRACLLSGQYSPRHQIFNVGTNPRGAAAHRRLEHIPGVSTLDPEIQTWARQLQDHGYRTGSFGKWHLSSDPKDYGFDVNVGGDHRGSPPRGYYPPHPNAPGLESAPEDEYLTDRLTDEAIAFMRGDDPAPWLVYLTHFAVHTPIQPKKEWVSKYAAKPAGELHDHVDMATMIQAVDDGVGRIVAMLEETGQRDETVILFSSDNGGYGPATDMRPLKGYKGTYYEGGIRVPFFVCWPGVVAPGSVSETPITGVDFYPTLLSIAGASLVDGQLQDGVDLTPIFRGNDAIHRNRALFWHFPAYLQSYNQVVDEQRDPLFRTRPCGVIRKGPWKLIEYFEDGGLELYNLAADVGELKNLAKTYPEVTQSLHEEMIAWRQETQAPVPSTPNPKFDPQAEANAIARRLEGQ